MPLEVAFNATKDDNDLFQKKSVIFCWLTEVTLCHELPWITKWAQWLLKLLEKSLFFLQNTPLYSNTRQRTTASVPLPLRQTHSDQNLDTQQLQSSLTAVTIPNLSAAAMPSVSGVTTYGEALGGLIIKLWMNLTKHSLHAHAFGQKSIGFSLFGLTFK